MKASIIQPVIGMFVEERNASNLNELLSSWTPPDIAELIDEFEDPEDRYFVFQSLPSDLAAQTFEYLELHYQKDFLEELPHDRVPQILNEMSADDRTSLLQELPAHTVAQLLAVLSQQERTIALSLLGYAENSVGRLMTCLLYTSDAADDLLC